MNEFVSRTQKISFEKPKMFSRFGSFLTENSLYFKEIENRKKVIVKINIPFWETPRGSATRKESLIELITFLKTITDVPIFIAESRYGYVPTKVLQEYGDLGVGVMDFFEKPHKAFEAVSINNRKINLYISQEALSRSNFLISLGPPKTHEYVIYTGAVKTMMGFLKMKKRHMHGLTSIKDFSRIETWERQVKCLHENLVKLESLISVDVSILDGSLCMEGDGPVWGSPVRWEIWAISNNPSTLDYAISNFMFIDPNQIAYLWKIFEGKKELKEDLDDYFVDLHLMSLYGRKFQQHSSFLDQLRISKSLISSWKQEENKESVI